MKETLADFNAVLLEWNALTTEQQEGIRIKERQAKIDHECFIRLVGDAIGFPYAHQDPSILE
jgi:hypothetical protein